MAWLRSLKILGATASLAAAATGLRATGYERLRDTSLLTAANCDQESTNSSTNLAYDLVLEPTVTSPDATAEWDRDWDKRNAKTTKKLERALTDGATIEPERPIKAPTATRHILLVRHGQYDMEAKDDLNRHLTDVGKRQAQITGERLKGMDIKFDRVIASTMTRAQETANLICEAVQDIPREDCSLLREGAPWPPLPKSNNWKPARFEFYQDYPRIEGAFRKYIHRADVDQSEDTYDLVVCHGNVIRYFVCRALQFPREGWLRMSVGHCGMTWITIRPSGSVSLRELGGVQHLPPDIMTW